MDYFLRKVIGLFHCKLVFICILKFKIVRSGIGLKIFINKGFSLENNIVHIEFRITTMMILIYFREIVTVNANNFK